MHNRLTGCTTIKVVTRHNAACKQKNPTLTNDHRKCNCRKSIYIYENGTDQYLSAKTRSWEAAEAFASAQRDLRDPIKQKLREIEEREAAKAAAVVAAQSSKTLTMMDARDRWLNAQKINSNETRRKYVGMLNRTLAWANHNNIRTVAEVTPDILDKWRGEWSPDADEKYSRMQPSTQNQYQTHLRCFFNYIVGLDNYLEKSPAAKLKSIKANSIHAMPLSPAQFDELMAAIEPFCEAGTDKYYGLAAEIRSLFLLQRYTGVRIGDGISLARAGLVDNRLTLITEKTGTLIKARIVPDLVVEAFAQLSESRPQYRKGYYLLREGIKMESSKRFWSDCINMLNEYLHFTDENGDPMRFHSHMLRDTYAVELLLKGVTIDNVSYLLTHESIAMTEKYYAPWVKARRDNLEKESVAAMRGMGVTVTT